MTHSSTVATLKIASLAVTLVGLLLSLGAAAKLSAALGLFLDLAIPPVDGAQDAGLQQTRLLAAVAGGVMTGWGVMLWLVTTRIYEADPTAGRSLILPGLVVWFVVDGAASVAAGAWPNAAFNTVFLALFAIPLLAARRPDRQVAL